jgi:hypothetical protein
LGRPGPAAPRPGGRRARSVSAARRRRASAAPRGARSGHAAASHRERPSQVPRGADRTPASAAPGKSVPLTPCGKPHKSGRGVKDKPPPLAKSSNCGNLRLANCSIRFFFRLSTPNQVPFLGAVINKVPQRDHAITATQLRRRFGDGNIPLLGVLPDVSRSGWGRREIRHSKFNSNQDLWVPSVNFCMQQPSTRVRGGASSPELPCSWGGRGGGRRCHLGLSSGTRPRVSRGKISYPPPQKN